VPNFTYPQLEGEWIAAGGGAAQAPLAAAIAEAESGGNPLAAYPGTTVKPGQGSPTDATGLWQILGPPAGFSASQLTNPLENARMAVAKYKGAGNSFTPWVTYTTGAYRQFLQSGVGPAAPPPGSAPGPAGTGTGGPKPTSVPTSSAGPGWAQDMLGVIGGMFPFSQQIAQAGSTVSGAVSGLVGTGTAIEDVAGVFAGIGSLVGQFLRGIEILFTPTFWLRVICFVFAVPAGVSGLFFLSRSKSGSETALGILSVSVSALLLFVALHNIPPQVNSPGTLAAFIKTGLQGGTMLTAAPASAKPGAPYTLGAAVMAPPLTANPTAGVPGG
jgi:Lysozyme like domain